MTRIAVGGHSCGGLQALAVSDDPRVDTTLVLDSGIYICSIHEVVEAKAFSLRWSMSQGKALRE